MNDGRATASLSHQVAEIFGVAVDELEALADKELESGLNAVWRSRDLAGRRSRIKMFVLRCRLRGEPYLRIIAD